MQWDTQCIPKLKKAHDSQIWIVTLDFKPWKTFTSSTPKLIFIATKFRSKPPSHNNECIMHLVKLSPLDPLTTYTKDSNKGMHLPHKCGHITIVGYQLKSLHHRWLKNILLLSLLLSRPSKLVGECVYQFLTHKHHSNASWACFSPSSIHIKASKLHIQPWLPILQNVEECSKLHILVAIFHCHIITHVVE